MVYSIIIHYSNGCKHSRLSRYVTCIAATLYAVRMLFRSNQPSVRIHIVNISQDVSTRIAHRHTHTQPHTQCRKRFCHCWMSLVFSKDFVFCINFATSFHRLSSACMYPWRKMEDKTKWHQIHHFIDIGSRISHTLAHRVTSTRNNFNENDTYNTRHILPVSP